MYAWHDLSRGSNVKISKRKCTKGEYFKKISNFTERDKTERGNEQKKLGKEEEKKKHVFEIFISRVQVAGCEEPLYLLYVIRATETHKMH